MMNKPATEEKPVRPAATVLLVRDGVDGLEVFMVVRHHQIDSFSGALVFPGGKVDPSDTASRDYCRGQESMNSVRIGFRVAAVREAFEECGVLLAHDGNSDAFVSAKRVARLEGTYRQALVKGEVTMEEFCQRENLTLSVDQLVHYAHWITPPVAPKIFDTHFYLAPAPIDHVALHDGEESTDSVWIRPQDAIRDADEGRRIVVFPTRMNLMKLAQFKGVAEAIAATKKSTIVTVSPKIKTTGSGRIMQIPAEAGYPGSRFKVEKEGTLVTKVA
jgi:8-oxo-dGTP pyrophosphatase MutT (NUDIX family)